MQKIIRYLIKIYAIAISLFFIGFDIFFIRIIYIIGCN